MIRLEGRGNQLNGRELLCKISSADLRGVSMDTPLELALQKYGQQQLHEYNLYKKNWCVHVGVIR